MATIPSTLDHQGEPACIHVDGRTWTENTRHAKGRPMTEHGGDADPAAQKTSPIGNLDAPRVVAGHGMSAVPWRVSQSGSSHLFHAARERAHEILFSVCCLLVVGVSVYDAMLVVLHRSLIHAFERNPLGQWLLEVQGGDVWFFVSVKLLGTALVCAVLVMLHERRARLAGAVGGGLACVQIVLLWYLTYG